MKIAALIQAHSRPDLLAALVERLNTPLWNVYVHVDAKAELDPFTKVGLTATFLQERTKVGWGAFSLTEVNLTLLRRGVSDPTNTHFYLMSGQCFPIKSDEAIINWISTPSFAGNFMSMVKMPVDHKPLSRLTRRYFYDVEPLPLRRCIQKLSSLLPDRNVNRLLRGMQPWGGSTWWLINRDAATRLLDFIDTNPWYVRAFRHTLLPDEMFFQTLVNHLNISIDAECPTKTKWIEGRSNPQIITPEIFADLSQGWHFCLRKFDRPGSSFMEDKAVALRHASSKTA